LSSCIGSASLTFLRKKRKNISGLEILSKGIRRSEHPTGFETIFLEINLKSSDTTADDLKKVLKLSEDTYCPVWAMIKGNVEVVVTQHIVP
jgi:putative redox protein